METQGRVMATKRRRTYDPDDRTGEAICKRPKRQFLDWDQVLWPPSTFNLTYLAWASRQFSKTGFCIDFRARWLKSRHECPLCDRYDVRKAGDIDRLCETETTRSKIVTSFPNDLTSEALESIEYLMCSRPHGAQSFKYVLGEGNDGERIELVFDQIHHLGWPELSNLVHKDEMSDLTIDMNEQRLTIELKAPSITRLAVDEVALALVGYYLRSDYTTSSK